MKKWIICLLTITFVALVCFWGYNPKKESIVIGGVLSLTGDNALQGNLAQNGILLAIDFVNEEGGIGGKQVVLQSEDSKTNAKESIIAFSKLVNIDQVDCVLSTGDIEFQALNSSVDKSKVVTMATICSGVLKDNRSPYLFRYCYNEQIADSVLMRFLNEELNVRELVLVYPNNSWGQEIDQYTSFYAKQSNINIVDKEPFDVNSLEQKSVAIKILENNPSVICARGFGSSFESVLRSLKELGYNGIVVGDITISLPGTMNNTKGAVEGAYYVSFDLKKDDLLTSKYKERYLKKYGKQPTVWDALGFDACMFLLKGLERKEIEKSELRDVLYNIDSINLLLGNNIFKNSNDVAFNMNIYKIVKGEIVPIR